MSDLEAPERRPSPAAPADSYDHDFHAWALEQARLLREQRFNELDLANLAAEVEDMGKEQAHALKSYLTEALHHLLMLEHSSAMEPKDHWAKEMINFRIEIEDRLEDSPSLKNQVDTLFERAWKNTRLKASKHLLPEEASGLPDQCPYSLDQVRDSDFIPGTSLPGSVSRPERR